MLEISVPGYGTLELHYLVLDYNGTLARDGELLDGVKGRLEVLSEQLQIHVLTADTFGSVEAELTDVPCDISILPNKNQDIGKLDYVEQLGAAASVCIGNGRNDHLMLKVAALGLAVVQEEGAAAPTLMAADVIAPDILTALDLLTHPYRLIATLRS